MTGDWLTIRVVLEGGGGIVCDPPPGRVLLVGPGHTFVDLATAIDRAFARWDLAHLHEFTLSDGRTIGTIDEDAPDDLIDGDAVEVRTTVRAGDRFRYVFDLGDEWTHRCDVVEAGVDPEQELGERPGEPAVVYGWGTIPDQHGRTHELEDEHDSAVIIPIDFDDEPGLDEAWAAAEQEAAEVLVAGLPAAARKAPPADDIASAATRMRQGLRAGSWPHDAVGRAEFADGVPDDDVELLERAVGALVDPADDPGTPIEEQSTVAALQLGDWVAAVLGLVRAGPGASAEPEEIVRLSAAIDEVEGEPDPADVPLIEAAFELVLPAWEAAGVVDEKRRLTPVGRWLLPRAFVRLWGGGG